MKADIHDIEEVVQFGSTLKSCPYYGARAAVSQADIVVTPYNILLNKSTRDACGIKLDGNVVIVDEAHNLIETIGNINSVELSYKQVIIRVYSLHLINYSILLYVFRDDCQYLHHSKIMYYNIVFLL